MPRRGSPRTFRREEVEVYNTLPDREVRSVLREGMITVVLVGDVMLGRRVNDVLRTLRPEQPWGDVLPLLVSADLRIVNLECAITDHKQPWTRSPKVFHFRADPSTVEVLRAARVNGCSLANNHTLDFE